MSNETVTAYIEIALDGQMESFRDYIIDNNEEMAKDVLFDINELRRFLGNDCLEFEEFKKSVTIYNKIPLTA